MINFTPLYLRELKKKEFALGRMNFRKQSENKGFQSRSFRESYYSYINSVTNIGFQKHKKILLRKNIQKTQANQKIHIAVTQTSLIFQSL